jgi:hypothetical protein
MKQSGHVWVEIREKKLTFESACFGRLTNSVM